MCIHDMIHMRLQQKFTKFPNQQGVPNDLFDTTHSAWFYDNIKMIHWVLYICISNVLTAEDEFCNCDGVFVNGFVEMDCTVIS